MPSPTEKSRKNTLPTIDIAAIAGSPYGSAALLRSTVEALASPCRQNDGRPALTIPTYIPRLREMFRSRSLNALLPDRKQNSRIKKLTVWLIAVAIAAPPICRPKTLINSGSSAMFSTPPVKMPAIANLALPSARRILLSTNEPAITGAASRI